MLVDLKPTGQHYMEDLYAAGGVGAVLRELKPLLHLDCLTVTGETLGERLEPAKARWVDRAVVRPLAEPLEAQGGLVALFGTLAPRRRHPQALGGRPGAVRARGPRGGVQLARGSGRAHRRPGPRRHADDFLVLQNAGPTSRAPACRRPATCRSRPSSRAPA